MADWRMLNRAAAGQSGSFVSAAEDGAGRPGSGKAGGAG